MIDRSSWFALPHAVIELVIADNLLNVDINQTRRTQGTSVTQTCHPLRRLVLTPTARLSNSRSATCSPIVWAHSDTPPLNHSCSSLSNLLPPSCALAHAPPPTLQACRIDILPASIVQHSSACAETHWHRTRDSPFHSSRLNMRNLKVSRNVNYGPCARSSVLCPRLGGDRAAVQAVANLLGSFYISASPGGLRFTVLFRTCSASAYI